MFAFVFFSGKISLTAMKAGEYEVCKALRGVVGDVMRWQQVSWAEPLRRLKITELF